MYQRLTWTLVCLAGALLLAGCGSSSNSLTNLEQDMPGISLPNLSDLPVASGGHAAREVTPTEYDVLLVDPILSSPAGAMHADNILSLDPAANGGTAWAIYALPGFPSDEAVLPTSVAVDKGMAEVWIALSNYDTGTWEFRQFVFGGSTPLDNGAALFSASGAMHVAVVAAKTPVNVFSVTVTTSDELPGAPHAVINAPDNILEGYTATFDAVGSTGGDGTITELVWTFDGSDEQTTEDPATEVTHTFIAAGPHTVGLTVKNDLSRSGHTDLPVAVEAINWTTDLLVVYNSDIPDDLDLANYYCSPITGRSVDPGYMLGLPLGEYSSEISRSEPEDPNYETDIRDIIRTFLDGSPGIKANIKYIVLMKGIPHKIPGANEYNTGTSTFSSVDSELCLLYQEGYPIASWIWNDPVYQNFGDGDGFYLAEDVDFQASTFQVSSPSSAVFTLDYLVCRISAYTYDEARAIIDRSLAADTSGTAWTVFDSCGPRQAMDTMVDPVWPLANNSWDSGYELLLAAGFNVFADITSTRITCDSTAELPEEFVNSLIGYAGWGVNHTGGSWAHGNEYILEDLGWNYQPGCLFMSYESFNGTDLDDSDGIQRRGQGQIADFLRMGGTVAIGNAWEPFTIGVGDERWVFHRYIEKGDRWIEAAYKGLRLLSWQEIVVGDPLCRVAAD